MSRDVIKLRRGNYSELSPQNEAEPVFLMDIEDLAMGLGPSSEPLLLLRKNIKVYSSSAALAKAKLLPSQVVGLYNPKIVEGNPVLELRLYIVLVNRIKPDDIETEQGMFLSLVSLNGSAEDISDLRSRVSSLETRVGKTETNLLTLAETVQNNKTEIDNRVGAVEKSVETLSDQLDEIRMESIVNAIIF